MVRRSRRNPLVEFDRQYSGTVGSGDYYYGPMLKADAEEKFRASLAASDRVLTAKGLQPLPLSFVIRAAARDAASPEWEAVRQHASALAASTKSVAMIEFIYGRTADRAPKPGDSNRETPHTLFNALHRLCELIAQPPTERNGHLRLSPRAIGRGDISHLPFMTAGIHHNFGVAAHLLVNYGALYLADIVHPKRTGHDRYYPRDCVVALLSSGLNTASGRLGAIDDTEQALAEAFAKFCLSTDQVYDENAPLMLGGKPVRLESWQHGYLFKIRKIWGVYLSETVRSLVQTFGLFVDAYYGGPSPIERFGGEKGFLEHTPTGPGHWNSMLPKDFVGPDGEPLAFEKLNAFETSMYAEQLYKAVMAGRPALPSREQEQEAYTVVWKALTSLLTQDQIKEFGRRRDRSEAARNFLRERYQKPRNTPQSIAKARTVLAALDVLEARQKPLPGLYVEFIQPQE